MKKTGIILLAIFAFICIYIANKEVPFKAVNIEFISSHYKSEKEGIIDFKRIVKDSISVHLIEGKISHDENYNTLQAITKQSVISKSNIDSIKLDLESKGYRRNFGNYGKVIFVQIQPKNDDDLQILNLRHNIENRIDDKLFNEGLGEWFAGDLGPGGANMLFAVKDWNKSTKLIMGVLNGENLLDQSLIVKRIYTAKDDWSYEIIYPIDYNGVFIPM